MWSRYGGLQKKISLAEAVRLGSTGAKDGLAWLGTLVASDDPVLCAPIDFATVLNRQREQQLY